MSNEDGRSVISMLNLPESLLQNILKRLSHAELCILSQVCTYLRHRCSSDCLWEKILKRKWGKLIGYVARQEWNWHVESRKRENLFVQYYHKGSLGSIKGVWPNLYLGSYLEDGRKSTSSMISDDSVMAMYISLETGRFWFPAQAYTKDTSEVCCYDVLLSYNARTNTFRSRYRHGEWKMRMENIPWDWVRTSIAENPPNVLQCYDCLNELTPGDKIEIQWRGVESKPYDWWYGTIGHYESCRWKEDLCDCHDSGDQKNDWPFSFALSNLSQAGYEIVVPMCLLTDTLMVVFKQYSIGSVYRQALLDKKRHDEQASERAGGGFYGGIRKLRNEEEIVRWETLLALAISNSR